MNQISGDVVDAAIRVHERLGPGLFEQVYRRCLAIELTERGRRVETEVPVRIKYGNVEVGEAYRADMVVDRCVLVELKAVDALAKAHTTQILTYLRLGGYPVGLLINFHAHPLKEGIRRLVARLPSAASGSRSPLSEVSASPRDRLEDPGLRADD